MPFSRCPSCQLPLTEAEGKQERCPMCQQPFPVAVAAVSPEPPRTIAPSTVPKDRPGRLMGAFLVVGFLLLASLIWFTKPTTSPSPASADRERLEERLARLEQLTQAASAKDVEAAKASQQRLDQLERTMASLSLVVAEHKAQTQQLAGLNAKLDALSQRAFGPPSPPGPLQIRVLANDWGDADPENLQAVCLSAAAELWQYFPDRRVEPITVNTTAKDPMVIFGRGPDGERRVLLNVKGKLWARASYQFAHEFCHILCNYRDAKNPYLWFEEALCETASLFALRKMATTWKNKPPYPNWKSYASALEDYANTTMREVPALDNMSLAEWFAKNESVLRTDGTNRPRNRLFALAFLKLLEKNPHHWQAIGFLNQWDAKTPPTSLQAFLADWHQRVPALHKPFVQEIATVFALTIQ